jgi:hypothetical protein
MNWIHEIDTFIKKDNKKLRLRLRISAPIYNKSDNDYYCLIDAPKLFHEKKKIYGADKEQAKSLALTFANNILSEKNI